MEKATLLIIEPDSADLDALVEGLQVREDWILHCAPTRKEAMNILSSEVPDLILCAFRLRECTALDLLPILQERFPNLPFVITAREISVENAIQAIRAGAAEVLMKPLKMPVLRRQLADTLARQQLRRSNRSLREALARGDSPLVGNSPGFLKTIALAEQVAPSRSTVLITGESGTGKEIIANAIHSFSRRSEKPFVKINCGAIPENLMESELFGYQKGAFTGAHHSKKGRFEMAHEGTLFLDEIGDLPKAMQVKLLRALQSGEIERVGATETVKVDVRVIAATNQDLETMVSEGQFRDDLFYRLNVIAIHMPPLRERIEDIALLTQFFIERYNVLNDKLIEGISPRVLKAMQGFPWKGNIRELENMVERAVVLAQDPILEVSHFPALAANYLPDNAPISVVGLTMAEIEKLAIIQTLQHCHQDKHRAANMLQISLATLYRKIKEYQIPEKNPNPS
ncbi:MAG TPA: sigma-54 dependent transcriptional regulator [Calditrichia bacterium]|nr:sigma-54-dependent Fis family transcriptional regulator [Calditrichota bacterium]HQU71731.1 sigma-54 dependent transcriptional regulator [Calditrichia bacterium]HQV30914.1 sigma-54 dependent transcriptional regulator [Calditrichia bacterium]